MMRPVAQTLWMTSAQSYLSLRLTLIGIPWWTESKPNGKDRGTSRDGEWGFINSTHKWLQMDFPQSFFFKWHLRIEKGWAKALAICVNELYLQPKRSNSYSYCTPIVELIILIDSLFLKLEGHPLKTYFCSIILWMVKLFWLANY